jgi:hypothetical protein
MSDTQATITVPSDAPLGPDTLGIANTTSEGYSSTGFTVTSPVPQPVIASFTPTNGPVGTVITVTGSGFAGATYANVGWAGDAGITVVNDTQATITVPSDAPLGADALAIGNASYAGYSSTTFTVASSVPQPVITSFTPSNGPGGTVITVTGSGFTGATSANVGWAGDAGITVVSDTQATITVPTDAPLGADALAIGNTTYSGYSSTGFTVTSPVPQPVIASFTPSSGPVGTVITVTGSGFTGATFAQVSWAGDAGITVVNDTQATITVPADAPLGDDTLVVGNTTYSGYSSSSFAVTAQSGGDTTPPTAPSGLTPTVMSSTQINLSWTASTDNVGVTGYQVESCSGASCTTFAQIGTPATTTYSASDLTASTTYSFRVRATDAAGNLSGYSATTMATTSAASDTTPPTAPGTPTLTVVSSSQINLSWSASTDNVGVTGYRVEGCSGANCTTFGQIGTPTTTTYSATGLTASTSYSFRVRANDDAGNLSSYSSTASGTTSAAPDNTPPTAPGTPTLSVVSSNQINLTWAASTDNVGVTGYLLERCSGASCTTFTQIATPTTTSSSDTGLTVSTSYSYRVRATDAAGNLSGYSGTATATTMNGTNIYTYSANGQLSTVTTSSGLVRYLYDAAGNVIYVGP